MKTGDKLIAIDPCVMEYTNRPTLTVGKEYEVVGIKPDSFCIIDDDEDLHEFNLGDQQFFKQKKDENI